MSCRACHGVAHEWVENPKTGAVSIEACPNCPAPDASGEALDQVLGAILYDDGSHAHWDRAKPTLQAIPLVGMQRAVVAWMALLVRDGKTPTLANVLREMGPERCTPLFRWFLFYLVDVAAYARDFDAALVNVVRDVNRRRAAMEAAE